MIEEEDEDEDGGGDEYDEEAIAVEDAAEAEAARQEQLERWHNEDEDFEVKFDVTAKIASPLDEKKLQKAKDTGSPMIHFASAPMIKLTFPSPP